MDAREEIKTFAISPVGNASPLPTLDPSEAGSDRNAFETIAQADDTNRSHLEVRCPGCRASMEVTPQASLTELVCESCGSQFNLLDHATATWAAPTFTKLGRFELVEQLGMGAFGTVWKARDKELDRTVAIKVPRRTAMTPDEIEKFFREARTAAQLRHPNIVSVHEVGRDGDSVYIVSDLVRGVTLDDWLSGQQPNGREAARLCAKIAGALQHAHEQGVVHRDLKPANIMIDVDGEPHLMDFGLARREVGEVTMTVEGQVLGTPAYMSPEQAQGEAHTADCRSDIYSLGVILFQLLTGELPFRGNPRMLMHQVMHDEPPSPRKFNANISKDLETITLKCLEKVPARRYATADAVAQELQCYLEGRPIYARPIGRIQQTWRWCKRNPVAAVSGGVVISALAAVTIVSSFAYSIVSQEKQEAQQALANEATQRKRADEALEVGNIARKQAETALAQTQAVLNFLVEDLFGSYESHPVDGKALTVTELLKKAETKLAAAFAAQPIVEGQLRYAIAAIYHSQSESAAARQHIDRAVEILNSQLGDSHEVTLQVKDLQAQIVMQTQPPATQTRALEALIDQHKSLSPDHPELPWLLLQLARIQANRGDTGRATNLVKEAETLAAKRDDITSEFASALTQELANLYRRQGRLADAEQMYAKLVEQEPYSQRYLYLLAEAQRAQGKTAEALLSAKKCYDISPMQGAAQLYASMLRENREYSAAATVLASLIEPMQRSGYKIEAADFSMEAAACFRLSGDANRAEALIRRASEVYRAIEDPVSRRRQIVGPLNYLADLMIELGKPVAALTSLEELRTMQPINPGTSQLWGVSYYRTGKYNEAVEWMNLARKMRLGRVAIEPLGQGGNQKGFTPPGAPGLAWHRLRLEVHQGKGKNDPATAALFIDDLEIGTTSSSDAMPFPASGMVAIGYMDPYASISEEPRYSFAILDNLRVSGAISFEDNFERDTSSEYLICKSSDDVVAEFATDYGDLHVPPAPNSREGDRRGLKLAANQRLPEGPEAVTLCLNRNCEGDCILECDIWMNYPISDLRPATGSTEFVTLGVLSDGTKVNGAHNDWGSGVWIAVNGDGGVSRDFRFFVGPEEVVHFESAFGNTQFHCPT